MKAKKLALYAWAAGCGVSILMDWFHPNHYVPTFSGTVLSGAMIGVPIYWVLTQVYRGKKEDQ
jgi:cytosine/uracil/thiamine/allantoin permease